MEKRKRIDSLTAEERAKMAPWAKKWIDIGLNTTPTNPEERERFAAAVAVCYRSAGLEPPRRIVLTTSPLVACVAGPTAAYILAYRKAAGIGGRPVDGAVGGAVGGAVRGAVGGAVGGAVRDAVDGAVGGAVGGAVRGAVRGAVDGAVGDAVRDAVRDAVGGAVGGAVRGAVDGAVYGAVDGAVYGAVGGAVGGAVRDAVGDAVDGAVYGAVGGAVRDAVDGAVGGAVRGAVRGARKQKNSDPIIKAAFDTISQSWSSRFGGQLWCNWQAYTSFFTRELGLDLGDDLNAREAAYATTCETGCYWWPHRDFVIVSERPKTIARDELGRLHRLNGPAFECVDGWGVYSVHGVRVPGDLIEDRASITVARIDAENNAEIRRVMVELYGIAKYVSESGATVVHEDVDSLGFPRRLLRREMGQDADPILMCEVTNSSPEPDGSRRLYHLHVHPELRPMVDGSEELGAPQAFTCHNAVASTFGLRGEQYYPQVET